MKKEGKSLYPVSRESPGFSYNQSSKKLFICGGYSHQEGFDVYDINIAEKNSKWNKHSYKH